MLKKKENHDKKTTHYILMIILIISSICISLIIAEISLRFIYPDGIKINKNKQAWEWLVYEPLLGWKNQANYVRHDFQINANCLRGPEFTIQKKINTKRIICIGDSRTFGTWLDADHIRYDNNYPFYLQQLFNKGTSKYKIEVINAGTIGYTSSHGLRQYITKLSKYQPDVIVVSFGFNDFLPSWMPSLKCSEPRLPVIRRIFYFLQEYYLFQLGMWTYQNISFLHPSSFHVNWVNGEKEYAYNLNRFVQITRNSGVHLLFLNMGLRDIEIGDSLPALNNENINIYGFLGVKNLKGLHLRYQQYQSVVNKISQSENIPIADADKAFSQHRGEPVFGLYDLVHVNKNGAKIIAKTVQEKILELKWLY